MKVLAEKTTFHLFADLIVLVSLEFPSSEITYPLKSPQ